MRYHRNTNQPKSYAQTKKKFWTWKQTLRTTLLALMCIVYPATIVVADTQNTDPNFDVRCGQIFDCPAYAPNDGACDSASTVGPGTLPKIIPEPYNGAFTSGANKYKVAPALIAALFTEENFTATPLDGLAARWTNLLKTHPDPNSGWPTNSLGTMGAFQFLHDTWYGTPSGGGHPPVYNNGMGVDNSGDSVADPQNILDAAASAANYGAHNGATVDKPPASWKNFIFNYNHADWYVTAVMTYYNFYNTGGTNTSTTTSDPPTADTSSECSSAVSCNNSSTASDVTSASSSTVTPLRSKVVCIALNELALWKTGQIKPGTGYFKYSQNQANNWCAWFVSWVYNQAGDPIEPTKEGIVGLVADIHAVGNKQQSFHTHHNDGSYVPRPGDMAIHNYAGADSHINIVVAINGKTLTLVGGNQNTYDFSTSVVSSYQVRDYTSSNASVRDSISDFVSPD